ncbi:hypothetical protein SCLCIDRAFT_1220047 [Scleroderma citrinum Foug A]|uniref:Secreted protein n=1 Tax=Scleroderma citrinum Foug A TaxID=1036808 RepID=A0A0C3D7Q3_9AGAM|nr:hypothetical protein SCLCIDRAFT_1220047 [Scleroderma citrinum Foug A]
MVSLLVSFVLLFLCIRLSSRRTYKVYKDVDIPGGVYLARRYSQSEPRTTTPNRERTTVWPNAIAFRHSTLR